LRPLAKLPTLRKLRLAYCDQLSDLSPLAGLTSLQELDLTNCQGVRHFASLEPLLPVLQKLHLFGCKFEDLPAEFCGEAHEENVLAKVRAHFADLEAGQEQDAEVKVLFLGNGGTGKSQLCRRSEIQVGDSVLAWNHADSLTRKQLVTCVHRHNVTETLRLTFYYEGADTCRAARNLPRSRSRPA
jgi:internalin A